MNKYALFIDGEFQEVRDLDARPKDISHKKVAWYPVGERVAGAKAGWSVQSGKAIETFVEFIPQEVPLSVQKTTIWVRMSDEEAAAAKAALTQMETGSPRLYLLFNDAVVIRHDTDFFPQLKTVFVSLYGEERATELLAGE